MPHISTCLPVVILSAKHFKYGQQVQNLFNSTVINLLCMLFCLTLLHTLFSTMFIEEVKENQNGCDTLIGKTQELLNTALDSGLYVVHPEIRNFMLKNEHRFYSCKC